MEKLDMHSPDLTAQNIDKIAELFPTVITESLDDDGNPVRAVNFDLLRQELSDHVVQGPQERYQLDWPGKREALFAANAPIAKTLRPVREESVDFDTTKNLFIEGDNLDALKLLQESYLGKVKVIYIDPPYNTANDFIYNDNFAETTTEYLERSRQVDEEGARLVPNPESNGRRHSDWLSMMYSRLKLARNLLADDGVLIAAIDDHEHANLRSLLDLVFGEDNFLANAVWQGVGKNDARFTAGGLDYMLMYGRNKSLLVDKDVRWYEPKRGYDLVMEAAERAWHESRGDQAAATSQFRQWWASKPDTEKGLSMYAEIDETGQPFRRSPVSSPNPRENLMFDVLHPVTNRPVVMPSNGWRYSQETMAQKIKENRIVFGKDETATISSKTYLNEVKYQAIRPAFFQVRANASAALKKLLEVSAFDYPKDVAVLAKWINAVTVSDKEALVLDLFAGSGSTGEAVMTLNAADGGHRRFILVQLDEAIDHPDYESISGIARERLRRAGVNAMDDAGLDGGDLDVGFRALSVATTNLVDTLAAAGDLQQLDLGDAVGSIKPQRTKEDLLFQVLLDWGLDLSLPITIEQIDDHEVFVVDEGLLVACFDEKLGADFLRGLASREPLRAVFLDSGFVSDADRINAEQIFVELSPSTEVKAI